MAEYLSRDAVFQVVHGIARGIADRDIEALKAKDVKAFYKAKGAKEILDSVDTDLCYIPAADVQPVQHGRWVDCTFYDPYEKSYEQNFEYKCSYCGHMIYNKPNDDNLFCGHCSARMDLNDGEHIAEIIRNNLERMVETRNRGHLIVCKENDENEDNSECKEELSK